MSSSRLLPLLLLLLGGTTADLQLEVYENCAMHGHAHVVSSVPSLHLLQVPMGCSAEVTGTLTYNATAFYAFDCSFDGGHLVFVWIDDHLVCHTDPPIARTPSSTDGSPAYPLHAVKGETATVVIHVYAMAPKGYVTSKPVATIDVQWAAISAPAPAHSPLKYTPVPRSALDATLPPNEVLRRQLQNSLKSGWNLWTYNLLDVARLPDSFALSLSLCQLSTQQCLTSIAIEDTLPSGEPAVRVGPFATDQSYWQLYVAFAALNVSISATGGSGTLHLLVEPTSCDNCSDYSLRVSPRYVWYRAGAASVDGDSLRLTPQAMNATVVAPTRPPTRHTVGGASVALAFSLGEGAVGLREGGVAPTLAQVRAAVAAARSKEVARYGAYGAYGEVKEALQAATMWNYIYTPAEYGPFLPVSRSWNFVKKASNSDWKYVIFDWDNIFASYMTALDPTSKDISYSNLIQVVRSRTARGFVPNFSAGGSKSVDRTEPPIGAKVLLEIHAKYRDLWLVELLFDDLLRWNDWFIAARTFGPLGLVSLGSDHIDGYTESASNQMQGARYESGLDNSPMYDGEFFNRSVAADGSFAWGQMELYDVGFASMFVQEAECLAQLAALLNRSSDRSKLLARAAAQRSLISEHLWDEQASIFTNRWWNGSFYRRISPTSFYSMLAQAATDEQATSMVRLWLLSPEHFCISPTGDYVGNSDDCYWGLPSIQKSDVAFPPLGYWRGYVWGPMAQLTYWSLQYYDHIPAVRAGRKALCKQLTALMLSQWRSNRHICENFSPHKNASDCSGTKFYHWGALTGLITLIEEGFYGQQSIFLRSE